MNKKKWITVILVIIVPMAIYFGFKQFQGVREKSVRAEFQTTPVKTGSFNATIGATGTVRSNQSARLAWQTSGTVERVNLKTGALISSGQLLAELEQTSLPQTVILAKADLVNSQRTLTDLLNSKVQQAIARQAVDDAERALEDLLNPELAQANALEAIAVAEKVVENAERAARWSKSPAEQIYIDEAEAQVVLAKDQLDKAKEDYAPYENKPEDNLTRARLQTVLSAAQQQYDATVRNLNSLQGTSSATEQAIAEADLATAKAQLLQAQREWERVKDGPSPADVSLLEAQLADAVREYERLKDGADPNDIAATEARIAAAQATINQAFITAPFNGTITNVITKPGDQVSPGSIAFRLDDLSRLLVDVQVSEVDINQIASGQPATLTFDSVPAKEYDGTVVEVASVGEIQQGVVNFKVTVALSDPEESIKPGMTAAVNFVIDQLEDVLLIPNRAVRIVDGKRVVYVLRSNTPQAVAITLGASSGTVSQILDGELQVGDIIVLNPPDDLLHPGAQPFRMGN